MTKDWIDSPRGRREAVAVFSAAIVIFAVSLTVVEWYPFSAPSMFAVKVTSACEYELYDPDGDFLPPEVFGLQLNNPHDPPVTTFGRNGYGRKSPPSINNYSVIHAKETIVQHVRDHLMDFPEIDFVDCTQRIVGPRDDGSVGVVLERTWRIFNPRNEEVIEGPANAS